MKFFNLKKVLLLGLFCWSILLSNTLIAQSPWINEIHYDDAGGDADEGIEIAGPAGTDLSGYMIVPYNGNGGGQYSAFTIPAATLIVDENTTGFGAIFFPISGLQNGDPDGVALVDDIGTVLEFLSYEGSFTATNGPANGLTSTDIGVDEQPAPADGNSLQRTGTGTMGSDFTWTGPTAHSRNNLNAGQAFGVADTTDPVANCMTNTFVLDANGSATVTPDDIDNGSSDDTGITSRTVSPMTLSCADVGSVDVTLTVMDAAGNSDDCTVTVTVEDNEAPMLTIPANMTIECSDDSSVNALGMASATDNCSSAAVAPWINEFHYDNPGTENGFEFVEVAGQAGTDLNGWSLVLYNGNGNLVYNTINIGGVIDDEGMGFGALDYGFNGLQNGSPDGIALVDNLNNVIEFISYEGTMTAGDGPAAGMTSTDVGVSENNGTPNTQSLQKLGSGSSGADFTWSGPATSSAGMINDGQELGAAGGTVVISFVDLITPGACVGESTIMRTFTATDANNNSTTDTQTITIEDNTPPVLIVPADITVGCNDDIDIAALGDGEAFDVCDPSAPMIAPWINELHYDNVGGDIGEFIEIAGLAGTDLNNWSIVLYNGNGSSTYGTMALSGILGNEGEGYGFLVVNYPSNGIQNGPDAIALVDDMNNVVQFISYEGVLTANGGPADGMTSTNIGVFESSGTAIGESLQLQGNGIMGSDFSWAFNIAETPGTANEGQDFTLTGNLDVTFSDVTTPGPSPQEITITRTFTATDPCGNVGAADQIITIFDDTAPFVVCRPPVITENTPGICGNSDIILLEPFATDECGIESITNNAPFFFPAGQVTTVTWTVTDVFSNSTTCQMTVTINDNEAPEVECYGETIVAFTEANCQAKVDIDPVVTDNCGLATVSGTGILLFAPGVHMHTVIATDIYGNVGTCDYEIIVHDDEAPEVFLCPDDVSAVSPNNLPVQVNLPQPVFTDNCGGIASLTNDAPADGFPLGTTTVTWTATDTYGYTATCSYNVHVASPLWLSPLTALHATLDDNDNESRIEWNAPDASTTCEICAETDMPNLIYLGDFYGHQYFLYNAGDGADWQTASIQAEMMDGHLASINSQAENRFIFENMPENAENAWVGMVFNEEDNIFDWSNGDETTYLHFDGEFTNELTDGIGVLMQPDGFWNIDMMSEAHAYLIERPCVNITQTAPLLDVTDEESLLVSGQIWPEGDYEVTYELVDLCGNIGEYSFDVTINENEEDYCTTAGTDNEIWIESVQFGDAIMQTGEDEGYGDYSANSLILTPQSDDEPMTLIVNPGGNADENLLFWRVWFDLNNDGDFFGTNELVAFAEGSGELAIALPAFAENINEARVRVAVSRYDFSEPCQNHLVGEVEDFTLSVPATAFHIPTNGLVINNLSTAPNPANDWTMVQFGDLRGQAAHVQLVNELGQQVWYQDFDELPTAAYRLNLVDMPKGIYHLHILTESSAPQALRIIVQ